MTYLVEKNKVTKEDAEVGAYSTVDEYAQQVEVVLDDIRQKLLRQDPNGNKLYRHSLMLVSETTENGVANSSVDIVKHAALVGYLGDVYDENHVKTVTSKVTTISEGTSLYAWISAMSNVAVIDGQVVKNPYLKDK